MGDIELMEVDAPGLRPGEVAYQVDDHTVMAVRVRRRESPDADAVAFGVTARLIDGATGETCRCVADTPLEAPEHTAAIDLALIADGVVSLESRIEIERRRAVERVLHLRAALGCLHLLPEVPE